MKNNERTGKTVVRKNWQLMRLPLTISAFFIFSMSVFACTAHAENLIDVYRLALQNDPRFDIARYTLKADSEKYPQAIAGLLPTVNLVGSNNITHSTSQFSQSLGVERDIHAWDWTLQLTQPLVHVDRFYAFSEAKHSRAQANAQFQFAQQDMILRVTQAYFAVMSGREEIKVVEAELASADEQLKFVQHGVETGVSSRSDVLESQARLDLARANLVSARNDLDAKTYQLGEIVDDVPENLAGLSPNAVIKAPEPNELQFWINKARENNAAVLVAEAQLQVSEAVVGRARAEHTPTLDLVGSYGENYSSGSVATPTDYATRAQSNQVGLRFTMPLFAGGASSSHVSEARANKYRAGAQLEASKRQAATTARQAFSGVTNGLSQIAALKSAVTSTQNMLNESHAGYKEGIYDNFKVLDAEQKYYSAKRSLVKARYEALFQSLKLKAVAGTLSEADLVYANSLLVH